MDDDKDMTTTENTLSEAALITIAKGKSGGNVAQARRTLYVRWYKEALAEAKTRSHANGMDGWLSGAQISALKATVTRRFKREGL